jgi:hypothetical protein
VPVAAEEQLSYEPSLTAGAWQAALQQLERLVGLLRAGARWRSTQDSCWRLGLLSGEARQQEGQGAAAGARGGRRAVAAHHMPAASGRGACSLLGTAGRAGAARCGTHAGRTAPALAQLAACAACCKGPLAGR